MKTSSLVVIGLGAAVALYLVMRPKTAAVTRTGTAAGAAGGRSWWEAPATQAGTALVGAVSSWWNTPSETTPINLGYGTGTADVGSFVDLGG